VNTSALPPPVSSAVARSGGFGAWFRRLSLARKSAFGFGVAAVTIGILVVIGLGVLLALSLEFRRLSSQTDVSGAAAEIGLTAARLEGAVRDHLDTGDRGAFDRAEILRDEARKLVGAIDGAVDHEAAASIRSALDAYWGGIERITVARAERAAAGETMEGVVRSVRASLDTFRPAGGADSTAMAYDISVAVAEARDRVLRANVRRDPAESIAANRALETARLRVGEMNRYLWVQGTQKTRDSLLALLDEATRACEVASASLTREAAIRADTLIPNMTRVIDGATTIRARAGAAADAVRGGLSDGAWAIVRAGLIAAGVVVFLGLVATAWAFRAVTQPLGRLVRAVDELAGRGGRSTGGDELVRMADAVRALDAAEDERRRREARAAEERRELIERDHRHEVERDAKNEFLLSLGREIADPLNDIARRAEALMVRMHHEGLGETAGDAEMIQWSAERLTSRLESVVEYARIQIGDLVVRPETIDIGALTAEVRERCVPSADLNGDTLRVIVAPEIGSMWSDFDKLSRILVNLLDNACRNTRDGDVVLSVERVRDGGADRVRFVVRDTGVGFPPEEAERLFLPFARGESASGEGGTGLGLTLVAHYTETLGGTVEIASRPGEGTRVTVDLPASVPAALAAPGTRRLLTVGDPPGD